MIRREYEAAHVLERLRLKLPFWRYFELFRGRQHPFLLDSASDPLKLGRYSFMGSDPFLTFEAKRVEARPGSAHLGRIRVRLGFEPSVVTTEYVGDPILELRQLLAAHYLDRSVYAGRPVPFLAGAVGYFGYEAGYFMEELPDRGRDDLGVPDITLGFYASSLVHCHRTGNTYLSALGRGPSERLADARAKRRRDDILRRVEVFEKDPPPEWDPRPARGAADLVSRRVSQNDYCRLVDEVKEHICAGDIFEMCLTHRIESPLRATPWDLYRELRRINPAPFACYLEIPNATVVCSSPERFLRLGADRAAESRPIKGTRPRGQNEEEDAALYADLASSTKDQAENNMIVDLVRNDFGRVCRFGTVHVPELRIIERYATVYQMVSTIRGQLEADLDAIDLLKACFPGGSMTGAPKIEAMKIIDRLEPVKRSVYSGSVGYIDFSGPVDLNIVIRTAIVKDRTAYYSVGGAIVADSHPVAEYEETLDKARAMMTALRNLG